MNVYDWLEKFKRNRSKILTEQRLKNGAVVLIHLPKHRMEVKVNLN